MYIKYEPGLVVEVVAGQAKMAGTATFSAPVKGFIEITIDLANGFIFYYDPADFKRDHNVKVQDFSDSPWCSPPAGLFNWKGTAPVGSTTYKIKVPENKFYGVHLTLALPADCSLDD